MSILKQTCIIGLFLICGLWAMGEKPTTLVENALDTFSRVQYHALLTTVTDNAVLTNKEALREIVADCRHPEFPVNTVFIRTTTDNLTLLVKTMHNAKIQVWYVVSHSSQLQTITEALQNTELDGVILICEEPLSDIVKALEDTKIMLAQHKSALRLGCQIPAVHDDDTYQIFNTLNLAILSTKSTDPLAIAQDLGPLLNYAHEVNTPAYIVFGNTALLKQSTPAQLNKYVSFLNSVLDVKKYKGLVLSAEDIESIWQSKPSR